MRKQIVVIGLGRFGTSLAITLHREGHDVLAIDSDERNVQAVAPEITRAVQADATNEAVLRQLGVGNLDVGIVAIGSVIDSSVLATILLKRLGVPYVIARASGDLHGSILEKIGADKVVFPERDTGVRVALQVTLTEVSDYMSVSQQYGIAKLPVPTHFVGKDLTELDLGPGGRWEVAVLLIQRGREVIITPSLQEVIHLGDVLIISGEDDRIEHMLTESQKGRAKARGLP